MPLLRRSTRRGVIAGAAIANSRANKRAAQAAQPVAAPQAAPSTDDAIAQVKQLAALREQGILTDAEFEAKKKQLLGL